jgi:hypothetical protein
VHRAPRPFGRREQRLALVLARQLEEFRHVSPAR